MTTPYIGSKISLISKSEIRYEGILYTIDPKEATIALAKVKCFGTEARVTPSSTDASSVPCRDEVYEYIIFKAADIKELTVCETPQPAPSIQTGAGLPRDPAIVSASKESSASGYHGNKRATGDLENFSTDATKGFAGSTFKTENAGVQTGGGPKSSEQRKQKRENRENSDLQLLAKNEGADGQGAKPNRSDQQPKNNGAGVDSKSSRHKKDREQRSNSESAAVENGENNRNLEGAERERRRDRRRNRNRDREDGRGEVEGDRRTETRAAWNRDRRYDQQRYLEPPAQQVQLDFGRGVSRRGRRPPFDQLAGGRGCFFNTSGFQAAPGSFVGREFGSHQHFHRPGGMPPSLMPSMVPFPYRRGSPFRGALQLHGGGRRPQRQPPVSTIKFDTDYDFERANEEFLSVKASKLTLHEKPGEKDSTGDEDICEKKDGATADGNLDVVPKNTADAPESAKNFYNKNSSFFDKISCEALERSEGRNNTRVAWRRERENNQLTFGPPYGNFGSTGHPATFLPSSLDFYRRANPFYGPVPPYGSFYGGHSFRGTFSPARGYPGGGRHR